jgi:hypothetical protein
VGLGVEDDGVEREELVRAEEEEEILQRLGLRKS